MINVAILIRGHTRNYETLLLNFKNVLIANLPENYKIHIFIHTWHTNNYTNTIITDKNKLVNDYNINENNIIIDKQNEIERLESFTHNANKYKFKFQLYGIYKLKNMVIEFENKNNFKFDYVLFTRFDILYYSINFHELLVKTKNKILLISKDVYYDIYCLMDRKFLNIYGNMILYNFKKIKNIYNSYGINPIIKFIIKKYNIDVNYLRIGFIRR
ncbi:hypothetical protein crov246 [Cafeteria roenbergensis virus]|uniref:Glycosyltransferase n=1 Tax=Cafeteria roenbergensis virus (strain BV-PW1) TaxID=693272 RepID=E3T516_CROVB|nr:hypothetical protein crov246 [Cafeteria roenbergensis virus BV-PW1]ADO67279.1 hypothetical protein crov246 [Cafeteria roenbergensis virus BV-PW1]